MAARDDDFENAGESLSQLPLARRIQFWAFAALLVLAGAFYVGWGISYGVWLDNGLYAVVSVLALMGIAGMWLSLPNPPVTAPRA